MVYFGGVSGVCHDWQFDFDRSFTMYWHVYAQCCRRRLVFGQLDEALHCKTACSWFTPLFFNNFWSKIKWHVWLIHPGLVGVQYIKVLKEYIFVYSFPSLLLGFIFSSLSILNLEVRPEIKVITLALAFFLVYKLTFCVWVCVCVCMLKSSVLNSNSNGNVFGLLYSSYLYFEWVKIASLCQCFCVFIFLSCAAKNSACHLGISRLLLCRFRGHDMTNKEYALRRGVQWTFSIHSAYFLKNQSQNKKLSGSVWIVVGVTGFNVGGEFSVGFIGEIFHQFCLESGQFAAVQNIMRETVPCLCSPREEAKIVDTSSGWLTLVW